MAEQKTQTLEREYIIPLRKEWMKVSNYRRTGRAVKEIKKFIARHMKVSDRDVDKVKLDVYLNNEIWFKGRRNPPAKIKVKARKDGEIVHVTLAEMPEQLKFLKAKHTKMHKPSETKKEAKVEKKEESTDEKKEIEQEKEQSVADVREMEARADTKAQKKLTKVKEPSYHRMAMKK